MDEERFTLPGERIGCHVEVALRAGAVVRARLTRAPRPDTPALSREAREVRALVEEHLRTGRADLARVRVDLSSMPPFQRAVLEHLHRLPPGETLTYGELAARMGKPGAARAVGGAMRHNPVPFIVPCHRVVASSGKLGNYSGEGSTETKRRLLALERAPGYVEAVALSSFDVRTNSV